MSSIYPCILKVIFRDVTRHHLKLERIPLPDQWPPFRLLSLANTQRSGGLFALSKQFPHPPPPTSSIRLPSPSSPTQVPTPQTWTAGLWGTPRRKPPVLTRHREREGSEQSSWWRDRNLGASFGGKGLLEGRSGDLLGHHRFGTLGKSEFFRSWRRSLELVSGSCKWKKVSRCPPSSRDVWNVLKSEASELREKNILLHCSSIKFVTWLLILAAWNWQWLIKIQRKHLCSNQSYSTLITPSARGEFEINSSSPDLQCFSRACCDSCQCANMNKWPQWLLLT